MRNIAVQTHAFLCGTDSYFAVELRFDPNDELAGIRFLRFLGPFGTKSQIVLDRFPECLLKFFDGSSLKGDNVACVDHLAVEKAAYSNPITLKERPAANWRSASASERSV